MSKKRREYKIWIIIIIILILILILIDQLVKLAVLKNNNMVIIDGILKFTIYENISATYGVNINSTIMYILTNLIVVVIAFQFITSQNQFIDKKTRIFLSLVIAGGISNSIDRIFRGYVVEFIDFTNLIKLPIFNLADIYILIGWVAMVAIFTVFTAKELKNKKT